MIRNPFRIRLCLALLILNLTFIWGNSLLPGELSGALSGWLKKTFFWFLSTGSPDGGHGLLRKLAHFSEFTCLGICFTWLYALLRKPFWLAPLSGVLAACIDECIQLFVPERGPSIRDVAIDSAGVVLGVILLNAIFCAKKKLVSQKQEDPQK